MAKPVLLPDMGKDVKTVTIVEWLVKEGDAINKGDTIVIVETEKAAFEVEAPEPGVIQKLLYSNGDKAQVSKPIAYWHVKE